MTKFLMATLLSVVAALAQAQTAASDTSPGMAEVRAMGLLNGEALACGQPALVDRIRIIIVHEAPKTREIGEAFEAATTERFLALGQDKGACTDGRDLAGRVETAMRALRTVFGQQVGK